MRKLRALLLIGVLFSATALIISPSFALNGTTQADPTGDQFSKFLGYRGLYAKDTPVPMLDLIEHGFTTDRPIGTPAHDAGFMTFGAKTVGSWPKPGADPAGPDGFPAGVVSASIRWVYALKGSEANVATRRTPVGQTCSDQDTEYNLPVAGKSKPVRYNVGECNPITQGPYHPIDGFAFSVSLDAFTNGDGKVQYDWTTSIYDPIIGAYIYRPGQNHDKGACSWISPATSQTQTNSRAACTDASAYGAPIPTPGTLGGGRFDKSGSLVGNDWGATDRKTISLRIPYNFRSDLSDDKNGFQDETRTYSYMGIGNTVQWFTTFASGEVSVVVPPDRPLFLREIFGPVEELTGINGQQYLPPPYNDANYGVQTGAGFIFYADWAPGNPFAGGGGVLVPGDAGNYMERICAGSACGPDWGGWQPSVSDFQQTWFPGLNTGFCRYTTYYLGSTPSGVTTHVVDDPLGGLSLWGPGPDGQKILDVPGVPGSQDIDGDGRSGTQVIGPTGGDDPCFNIKNNNGSSFIDTGNGFQAA